MFLLQLFSAIRLQWHQYSFRETAALQKNQTVLFFSVSEWEKLCRGNKQEICWNGKMFDVFRVEKENQQIRVYGQFDSREDQLKEQIRGKKTMNDQVQQAGFFPFYFEETDTDLPHPYMKALAKNFTVYRVQLLVQNRPVVNPPPELF